MFVEKNTSNEFSCLYFLFENWQKNLVEKIKMTNISYSKITCTLSNWKSHLFHFEAHCPFQYRKIQLHMYFYTWESQWHIGHHSDFSPWPSGFLSTITITVIRGPGTFWPDPKKFFLPEGEKFEKFGIVRGNFENPDPNQKMADLTWPEQKIDPTQLRSWKAI